MHACYHNDILHDFVDLVSALNKPDGILVIKTFLGEPCIYILHCYSAWISACSFVLTYH